jgi:hypothetical protein
MEDRAKMSTRTAGGLNLRLKDILGVLPYTAELYWQLRQPGKPVTPRFDLHRLKKHLPEWRDTSLEAMRRQSSQGRRVMMFATQRYWIEHVSLLGMALAGQGHQVKLAYTPYAEWQKPLNRFDVRRQNLYAQDVLRLAEPALQIVPLLGLLPAARRGSGSTLPAELEQAVQLNALRDTQYTQQVEQVDPESDLYQLRLARDREAAQTMLREIKVHSRKLSSSRMGPSWSLAQFTRLPASLTFRW